MVSAVTLSLSAILHHDYQYIEHIDFVFLFYTDKIIEKVTKKKKNDLNTKKCQLVVAGT